MTEPKRYELDKLTDLLQFTPEQLEYLFKDLKIWHEIMQPLKKLGDKLGVELAETKFVWIDDKKHDFTMRTEIKVDEPTDAKGGV